MVCKTLFCTTALALALPWCAHAALPQTGLTYFNDFTGNWTAQHGEDAFPLGGNSTPKYCAVPGKGENQALDFAGGVHPWGNKQTALTEGTTTFTIAFRAKLGTTKRGILFALGTQNGATKDDRDGPGGLSFRRGDAPDSIAVATGRNHTGSADSSDQRPAWTFSNLRTSRSPFKTRLAARPPSSQSAP